LHFTVAVEKKLPPEKKIIIRQPPVPVHHQVGAFATVAADSQPSCCWHPALEQQQVPFCVSCHEALDFTGAISVNGGSVDDHISDDGECS